MKNRNFVAFLLSLLLSSSVAAAPKTQHRQYDFKARIQALFDAWGALDPGKAAPFYAKDAELTFFDIAPMKYAGWSEYAEGVKQQFAPFASAKWTVNDDAQTHQSGKLAWGTATWHGDLVKKDGAKQTLDGRYTCIWEKRGQDWLLVHEHMSVPLAPPQ